MAGINREYLNEHKVFRHKNAKLLFLFPLLAVVVAIIVFWWLKLVGITVTGDAFCGIDPHQHEEACFSKKLICEEQHEHISDCYESALICELVEHSHTADCFPDKTVDVETSADWKKTFEKVELSNDVAENLLNIASTQVGYRESDLNFELDKNAVKQGYTRYGEWYGNPYSQWNAIFVSFCLNYANANQVDDLMHLSAESMLLAMKDRGIYQSMETASSARGDVAFFDDDADGKADRVAIVTHQTEKVLYVIEGDVEGAVQRMNYDLGNHILGYGKMDQLYEAVYIDETEQIPPEEESKEPSEQSSSEEEPKEPSDQTLSEEEPIEIPEETPEETPSNNEPAEDVQQGSLNYYIPERGSDQLILNREPLLMMGAADHGVTYSSALGDFLARVVIKDAYGNELSENDKVHIGEVYTVSMKFAEINSGSNWVQFSHDENGYMTYLIPPDLEVVPFEDWHPITAKTENGSIENVGEYFVDENGMLRIRFFEDKSGVNFIDKYSNVDFTIDFNTVVVAGNPGSSSDITFNDKINVNLQVDGEADMDVVKTHGHYDGEDHTVEYTIRVEATKGMVSDLVIDDQIWDNFYALRDTIVVTDLDGNPINPQPTIENHPSHNSGAEEGFRLKGFPSFSAGNGFLIRYKTSLKDEVLANETVDMWNGVDATGKKPNGETVYKWAEDWQRVELERIDKQGHQSSLEDADGNIIPVIEWEVDVKKTTTNLHGTVIIDTLGEGLSYYTGEPILIRRKDENDAPLSDVYLDWDQVTIENNSMNFQLPDGYSYNIFYYTTFESLGDGETKEYHNSVRAFINGAEHESQGSADVIGFTPKIKKTASGTDGKFVYFNIEADVPAVIKDWGHFYLTDMAAFWNYNENPDGSLYVENAPQDLEVTAVTEGGETIHFAPYQNGGSTENTFLLMAPAVGNLYHSFNLFFNTATPNAADSKWILDEDAKLTISYKIPFDAATGVDWEGPLQGNLEIEEVLLSGYKLANEVYFNYTEAITEGASVTYDYSPRITKHAIAHDDGIIDYTVMFNNNVPGSGGNQGYINISTENFWFTDTFDERLEYVPDSLIVTGYSPWNNNLWLAKYQYTGEITGNSIRLDAGDWVLYDYNEEANAYGWNGMASADDFKTYFHWVNAGGHFVFTYQLRVKDEYLNTTEHALLTFDNTAELLWDDGGSSGPATATAQIKTGLLDKSMVQRDSKLDYEIEINRNAIDIVPHSDTLEAKDTMKDNLSIYWESIKVYYHTHDHQWIDFDSDQSQYSYSVTFDPPSNSMTFTLPDSLHVKIAYTTLITDHGMVSVQNTIQITGKDELTASSDAKFQVTEHSGDASGSNHSTMLMKEDALTNQPLSGAEILLYGPMGDPNATVPEGVAQSIVIKGDRTLRYIGSYTTGADGTSKIENQYLTMGGPYALVEKTPPDGYQKLKDPVLFYYYEPDPEGIIQTITTIVVVENAQWSVIIPETGGSGPLFIAMIGFFLIAFPILYYFILRRKGRRLK